VLGVEASQWVTGIGVDWTIRRRVLIARLAIDRDLIRTRVVDDAVHALSERDFRGERFESKPRGLDETVQFRFPLP
jgi:hypothetical protein